MSVLIRYMKKHDLKEAVQIDRLANSYDDPDIGRHIVRNTAWDEKNFLEILNQEEPPVKAWVAEMQFNTGDLWIFGSMILELHEKFFGTILLSMSPYAIIEVREAFCSHMKRLLKGDGQRERLYLTIRDDDYENLKFWKNQGFKEKLLRNKFGDDDGWLLCLHKNPT